MGLSVNNKQKVRQAIVKISRGGWKKGVATLPPPLSLTRYVGRNGLTIGGLRAFVCKNQAGKDMRPSQVLT